MRLLITIILLQMTNVHLKKRHRLKSSESIENIIYYKDCNHKKTTEPNLPLLRAAPQQQECKMCCTMCCGDQCVTNSPGTLGRETKGVNIEPNVQPIVSNLQQMVKRKKIKTLPIQPLPKRRGLSFTRENIKSLISSDDDIRKILKDLVRVTMQKVDLMDLINAKRNVNVNTKFERTLDDSEAVEDL